MEGALSLVQLPGLCFVGLYLVFYKLPKLIHYI